MTMAGTMGDVARTGAGVRRKGTGLLVAVFLLSGCPSPTITQDGGSVQTGSVTTSGRVALIQPPPPKTKPVFRSPEPSVTAAPGQALAATGKVDPEALVGLDQGQTRRLLGVPVATEEEAAAKVWRYANGNCTLKVFFFMDMASQDFRALSYDMKSSENVTDVDQRCFAHLLAQGGGGHD